MKSKILLIVGIFLIVLVSSTAYPVITTEKGINHTQAKELVYSIPEEYYEYIGIIQFTTKPAKTKIIDNYGQKKVWQNWADTKWDYKHQCYNGKIIMQNATFSNLQHEIGHIYELCKLKKDKTTEEFADKFRI